MRPSTLLTRLFFLSTLTLISFVAVGFSAQAYGCFGPPIEASQELSLELGIGQHRTIEASLYRNADDSAECRARISVPFSSFPTSSLATRPVDVARVLREIVDQWGAERCHVMVLYENDTRDEFKPHELCRMEEFRFDKGDFWSTSSEDYCWQPADVEVVSSSPQ